MQSTIYVKLKKKKKQKILYTAALHNFYRVNIFTNDFQFAALK